MKNVTLNDLRDLLDEMNVRNMKKDDVLRVQLSADEDFGEDVGVIFEIEDARMRAVAWAYEFTAPRADRMKALEFCNQWNADKAVPRAYLDSDGDFRLDLTMYTDVELEKSYIKENFIHLFMATAWQFFKEAGQAFGEDSGFFEKD